MRATLLMLIILISSHWINMTRFNDKYKGLCPGNLECVSSDLSKNGLNLNSQMKKFIQGILD